MLHKTPGFTSAIATSGGRWIPVGLFVILAPFDCHPQSAPPQPGDVMQSGVGAPGDVPVRAFRKLHQMAAEITADPSSGYRPVDNDDWPAVRDAQKGWSDSMAVHGNDLTREQRRQLIPCAVHLNIAIDSMERGYRIEISQRGNPAARKSVQGLYAKGRAEFASCSPVNASPGDILQSGRGNPTGPPNDVLQSGGTPSGPPSDVFQSGNNPGNQNDPGGTDKPKGVERQPPSGRGPGPKKIPFIDDNTLLSRMNNCLVTGRSKIVYYSSPLWVPVDTGKDAYLSGTIYYNKSNLDAEPPWERVYTLAPLFAQHIQALENQRYGTVLTGAKKAREGDMITGYLAHCLADLSPENPFPPFEKFLGRTTGLDKEAIRDRSLWGFVGGWYMDDLLGRLPREITHLPWEQQ